MGAVRPGRCSPRALFAQGVVRENSNPGGCNEREMGGRERSQANGLAMRSCWSGWPALQREASGQLRVQRPERVGSEAALLPVFSSYAAVAMRRPDLMAVPTAMLRDAKQSGRSARWTWWLRESGMPCCFCVPPPLIPRCAVGWGSVPWVGIPAGAGVSITLTPQQYAGTKRR